ncbi:type II secretion system F family protein [Arthrobacter sp. JSM 101049]|uniref:type II secretion system F family protein n=1 Tax=Arthrobacter sp. JSM 101049 TaxID=929097 RepID=UPI0035613BED
MSMVMALAAVLAGAACWLLPPSHPWRRRRHGPGGGQRPRVGRSAGPGHQAPALALLRSRRAGREAALDGHVEAFRHLAALLRSGRHPAEAWTLLEDTWSARQAAGAEGGDGRPSAGRRNGPAPAEAAAGDIIAACRAARVAHATGAGPSAGVDRHLRSSPRYRHAWERLDWCIRLSESTGAPLGDLLNRLADQLEAEQDRRRALEATLAGPRMTQKLLAWLPALGLGLAQLMGAEPLALLTGTATGRACLAAGAALWWANGFWCRRLLAGARPHGHPRPRKARG